MSLFGLGESSAGPPPLVRQPRRPVMRSSSNQELGSGRWTDSSGVHDLVFGGHDGRPTSASSGGGVRRITELSGSMRNGDSMRDVMAHVVPPMREGQSPRVPTREDVRRWRSLTPQHSSDNLLRGLGGGDSDSECGSIFSHRSNHNSSGYRNGSPRKGERRDDTSPPTSPGSPGRAPSVCRSEKSVGGSSAYNPRAKPGSVASEHSRAMSARSHRSECQSRCTEDHMWREVFHSENDARQESRLRGAGKAIGNRGKASTGIPWRSIPSYDSAGRLCETGDPLADRKSIIKSSGIGEKKRSSFSPRLESSIGIAELLSPVSENLENRPPASPTSPTSASSVKIDSDAREAWLDVVKKRVEAKRDKTKSVPIAVRPVKQMTGGLPTTGSYAGPPEPVAACRDPQTHEDLLHWSWRSIRKGVATSSDATKDTCPWQRDDSDGAGSKAMQVPGNRVYRSPSAKLCGAAIPSNGGAENQLSAEQVVENRRDWQFAQDKWDRDDACDLDFHAQDSTALGKCANIRSSLTKSASARSFSSATLTTTMNHVHSIRARPDASYRPRWK